MVFTVDRSTVSPIILGQGQSSLLILMHISTTMEIVEADAAVTAVTTVTYLTVVFVVSVFSIVFSVSVVSVGSIRQNRLLLHVLHRFGVHQPRSGKCF